MSIFSSYALPAILVWRSKNLLELLKKNKISTDNVRKVVIGPRKLDVLSREIAENELLTTGEFVEIFLDKDVYYQEVLSDS
jgi:hypothetical protein